MPRQSACSTARYPFRLSFLQCGGNRCKELAIERGSPHSLRLSSSDAHSCSACPCRSLYFRRHDADSHVSPGRHKRRYPPRLRTHRPLVLDPSVPASGRYVHPFSVFAGFRACSLLSAVAGWLQRSKVAPPLAGVLSWRDWPSRRLVMPAVLLSVSSVE